MRIYAENPVIDDNPNTGLSASSITGATSLSIYNNSGFSITTNLALLGKYTDQRAEIVKTSVTASTSATLSTGTLYPHVQDTQFTLVMYDEVEFSRSDDGGTTWTVLATVGIQADRNSTVYVDNNGISTSLWRYRFLNSLTSNYSSYSTSLGESGYNRYQLESIQNRLVKLTQDYNMQILDYDEITTWINDCSDILAEEIYGADKMGLTAYLNAVTSGGFFTLPDDFVKLKRLSLSVDNINFIKATPLPLDFSSFGGNETAATGQFSSTAPVYHREDSSLYYYPTTITNYHLWYYRLATALVNPQDSLDLIFRPYSYLYIDYCMYKFKLKDNKSKDADNYYQIFLGNKARFVESMQRWQLDEPDMIDNNDFDGLFGGMRQIGKL